MQVLVVFQTDGEENASRKHTLDELRDLIERRKAEGWQFMFLGADIDAYAIGRRFGILEEATVSYSGTRSMNAMHALAETTTAYARGRSGGVRFTTEQKQAAGDDQRGADKTV